MQASAKIQELENSFIRFEYQDGLVEESISVAENDPIWSINIKRSLVSLLNNAPISNGIKNIPEITMIEVTKYNNTYNNRPKTVRL